MDRELLAELVDGGFLSPGAVRSSLDLARDQGEPLAEILVSRCNVPTDAVGQALARIHGCRFVAFDPSYGSADLRLAIRDSFLHRNVWVALRHKDAATVVVIDDPRDIGRRDAAEVLLGTRDVEWCVGLPSDIHRFIDYLYRGSYAETTLDRVVFPPRQPAGTPRVVEDDQLVTKLANQIIRSACDRGASDIHLEPYADERPMHVRFRIDGACVVYDTVPNELEERLVARIKIMAGLDVAEKRLPQDGKMQFGQFDPARDVELRVTVIPTQGRVEDVVLRVLSSMRPLRIEQMGLSERDRAALERLIEVPHGLLLVTGPTGSGKTTTLHAALAHINRPDMKIWTVEDPVEITQFMVRQVQIAPRIGLTFAAALRSLLRGDPDVIMVGEIRDAETASIAVEASNTGHLVLSTLHTNTAVQTVVRLLDLGVEPYAFADALVGVVAQRLVRKPCEHCRERYVPSPDEYERLRGEYGAEAFASLGVARDNLALLRVRGCPECFKTGYRGRLGLYEVLEVGDDLAGRSRFVSFWSVCELLGWRSINSSSGVLVDSCASAAVASAIFASTSAISRADAKR
jgi:type II secretory ATPase GspE/PulE/Tfp pilus assembly ATPase PilB-like protein